MRIARLSTPTGPIYARLEDARAFPLPGPPWGAPAASPSPSSAAAPPRPWAPTELLCPVEPIKIVCVGRNYAAHAKELGNEVPAEPLLFLKPPSSLAGPGGVIVLPSASARVEHESELTVVIGSRTRNVSAADAMKSVFGYTAANDVTARDLQKKDGQWTRAKGFDTFCPVGPWIETDVDPSAVAVRCRVNGALRQDAVTSGMIFDVPTLIAYISGIMTLEPGDIILTGTPEGVSPLAPGDVCEVEIAPCSSRDPLVLRSTVRRD